MLRLLLLAAAMPLLGQNPKPAEIDGIVAEAIGPNHRGCAFSVMRNGECVHKKGYGPAVLEQRVPITTSTRFNLASSFKQFTAAVILRGHRLAFWPWKIRSACTCTRNESRFAISSTTQVGSATGRLCRP